MRVLLMIFVVFGSCICSVAESLLEPSDGLIQDHVRNVEIVLELFYLQDEEYTSDLSLRTQFAQRVFDAIGRSVKHARAVENREEEAEVVAGLMQVQALFGIKHGVISNQMASALLNNAEQVDPKSCSTPYIRAVMLLQGLDSHYEIEREVVDEILALLDEAIACKPAFPEALFLRAEMRAEKGDFSLSIEDKERFVAHIDEVDPALGLFDVRRNERLAEFREVCERQIAQFRKGLY